jgi:hypothetical protein
MKAYTLLDQKWQSYSSLLFPRNTDVGTLEGLELIWHLHLLSDVSQVGWITRGTRTTHNRIPSNPRRPKPISLLRIQAQSCRGLHLLINKLWNSTDNPRHTPSPWHMHPRVRDAQLSSSLRWACILWGIVLILTLLIPSLHMVHMHGHYQH